MWSDEGRMEPCVQVSGCRELGTQCYNRVVVSMDEQETSLVFGRDSVSGGLAAIHSAEGVLMGWRKSNVSLPH